LRLITALTILCLSFLSHAQIDEDFIYSIQEQVKPTPEQAIPLIRKEISNPELSAETKIALQIQLAELYFSSGDAKTAHDIFLKVKTKAIKRDLAYIEAKSLFGLAYTAFSLGEYQLSLLNFKKAHLGFEELGESSDMGKSLMGIASIYSQLGSFEIALEYNLNALQVFQLLDDKGSLPNLNNNVGAIHFYLKDYSKAIEHYQLAIDIANEIGEKNGLSSYYVNKGEAHIKIKQYSLAEKALNRALTFSVYEQHNLSYIHTYLGKLFLAQGLLDKALVEFDKALVLAKTQGDKDLEIDVLQGKVRILIHNDIAGALSFAVEALAKSKQLNVQSRLRDSHKLLYTIYSKQNNFKEAFRHSEKYHEINSLIDEKDQATELVKLSSAIEIEQKKHKIELLKKDNALQLELMKAKEIQRNFLLVGIVVTLLLLFLFYRRQQHKKQSAYLKLQIAEKTKNIKALSEIGREITASLEINHIANIVYGHIKELFNADAFSIGVYSEDKQTIEFPLTIENDQHLNTFFIAMTEVDRPAVQCVNHRIEVSIGQSSGSEQSNVPNYSATIGAEMGSATYIPLLIESNIIGCITVQRKITGGFNDYQLNIMRTIAAYTAIAIDNALTHEALKLASNTDFLTQLPNRRAFIEKAQYQLDICQRNKTPLSFAIADIDKFKLFNDNYGHDGGDFVLKEVSNLFKGALRGQDLVARWGGEEFVFMLPNTSLADAEKVLEKIRISLETRSHHFNSQQLYVTATFGVTQVERTFILDELIDTADSALYQGKKSGRNKVVTKSDDITTAKDKHY